MQTFDPVEAMIEGLPGYDSHPSERSRWPQGKAESKGWVWETPVGPVPFGPTDPDEFLTFVESCEKPWPKDDPRREAEGQ